MNDKELRKTEAFEKYPVPRALAYFLVPTVLSQLAALILNLTDAFFIARTGSAYQVAAMTLTAPVYLTLTVLATIFGAGGNANVAASLGRAEREKAKRFSVFSLYSSVAVSIAYAVALTAFHKPFLILLGASSETLGFCWEYLFWTVLVGGIPLVINQTVSQLFLAEGESRISSIGITGLSILNVILDPIFIFSFNMGIGGAALATCVSNYAGLIFYLVAWLRRKQNTAISVDPKLFGFKETCSKVLAIGVPAGLVLLLTNICDLVRNSYVSNLGNDFELAGWGSVQKIMYALYMLAMGISQGARPLIAYNFAQKNALRTKKLINGTLITMAAFLLVGLSLINIFPEVVIKLFVTHEDAVASAKIFLGIWCFSLIGTSYVEVANSIFQAMGKWKLSLWNTIINKGFLLIPVMVLFANVFGLYGIPYSQIITDGATAIVLIIILLTIKY